MKGLLLRLILGIYDFSWNVLLFFLKLYSPKSRLGRWFTLHHEDTRKQVPKNLTQPLLLFACSSVGEYKRIETVAKHYSKMDFRIEISFFSPSGYNFLIGQDHEWDTISFLPFDRRKDVQLFLKSKNPNYVIISSNMIWPNFIHVMDEKGIRYSIVGYTYYPKNFLSSLFLRLRIFLIKKVEYVFCIDLRSKEILSEYLNTEQIIVTGDPRLESILQSSYTKNNQSLITQFKGDKKLLIIGSAYVAEVSIIIESYDILLNSGYKILIAPHELDHTQNIIALLDSSGIKYGFYSKGNSSEEICILDMMGILKGAYAIAEIAFIGGGWNNGIHNIVEAMIYKCTIISGPKFMKFPEAKYLEERDLLRVISGNNDIMAVLEKERSLGFQSKKHRCYKEWIEANNQAKEIIIKTLNEVI